MKTIRNALNVLEYIMAYSYEGSRLTTISEATGLNKTTVYNILQTLQEYGYVKKEDGSNKYVLGDKLLGLTGYILETSDFKTIAMPTMEALIKSTGQTINLMMLLGNRGYYAAILKPFGISTRSQIGESEHLYCSAVGKAILANLPEDQVNLILEMDPLIKRAPKTIVDRQTFFNELQVTQKRGFAIEDEENYDNSRCVAAPIFSKKKLVGSISISGSSSGVPINSFIEFSYLIQKAAKEIGNRLENSDKEALET